MRCRQQIQDFSLTTYKKLLQELLANCYSFQTLQDFIQQPEKKTVILRHDVDRKPGNALVVAKIEKEGGIKASYYFRIVKESYDESIIKQIAGMGHEIGYHYENLSEISRKPEVRSQKSEDGGQRSISHPRGIGFAFHRAGRHTQTHTDIYPADLAGQKKSSLREKKEFRDELFELAIDDFRLNLEKLRKLYPVKTICMHGSPLSKWDNRLLWKKYNYRDFGIIAEPYFDINWQKMFYLTDTGRKWNNTSSSVRDRVDSGFDIAIENTSHLISLAKQDALPRQIMINTHPQRWTDKPLPWVKELVWQNIKNVVKKWMVSHKVAKPQGRA